MTSTQLLFLNKSHANLANPFRNDGTSAWNLDLPPQEQGYRLWALLRARLTGGGDPRSDLMTLFASRGGKNHPLDNLPPMVISPTEDRCVKSAFAPLHSNGIAGMLNAYRARTALMRATVQYAQQHERTPLVRRQRDLEVHNFKKLVGTFLTCRDEIRHPDPEYAVAFALRV